MGEQVTDTDCPKCGKGLALYEDWYSWRDCSTDYDTTCPHCGAELEITVEAEPIFSAELKSKGKLVPGVL